MVATHAVAAKQEEGRYVTFQLEGERIAIALPLVRDVQRAQPITPVPRAPAVIAGLVNIRGRAMPALDIRAHFSLSPYADVDAVKLVVVEYDGERFALMVDALDEVATLAPDAIAAATQKDTRWYAAASGLATQDNAPIVVLDLAQFLSALLLSSQ